MAVRLDDSRPTYLQVADVLREEIEHGQVPPGARLPSVRDLSTRFDIAAVTVQSALRVLRDEGYIASRSTRGYFVCDELPTPTEQPSAEFTLIRDELETMQTAMRDLSERVSHLESAVHPPSAVDPPGSSPPRSESDG